MFKCHFSSFPSKTLNELYFLYRILIQNNVGVKKTTFISVQSKADDTVLLSKVYTLGDLKLVSVVSFKLMVHLT